MTEVEKSLRDVLRHYQGRLDDNLCELEKLEKKIQSLWKKNDHYRNQISFTSQKLETIND